MSDSPIAEYDEPRRRPDSTMSLLNDLMTNTVDQDYADVADRRTVQPAPSRKAGYVGLVAATLVFGLLLAVAAVQTDRTRPAVAEERAELIERIQAQGEEVDDVRAQSAELSGEVDALQSEVDDLETRSTEVQNRAERLGVQAGSVAVQGPGIQVVVDDGDDSAGEGAQVRPADLRLLVNGLWEAGAEAISINGERITSRSAIGWANQAITINFNSMRGPYTVRAIGDPNTIEARLFETSAGQTFRTLQAEVGMQFEADTVDSVQIPAKGVGRLRYSGDGPEVPE